MMNRRNMIKQLLGLSSGGLGLTGLWGSHTLLADELRARGKRVILLELSGANDGLNTLVPYRNDHYHRLRPSLGLVDSELIVLDSSSALHNGLEPLMQSWERADMAWVQGLGYPKPNRSHFKSIALWEKGGDGEADGDNGWMTHDIEHAYGRQGMPISDAHGISLVDDTAIFDSPSGRWISLNSASQDSQSDLEFISSEGFTNSLLQKVQQQNIELESMLASLDSKVKKVEKIKNMPRSGLGKQLGEVVKFIRAGVDTPVYRVQLSGFDTHENQLGRHARLLAQLSNAVAATRNNLIADKEWANTLIISYSEFGRRAAENRSGGTDHGTAAPHFVMGGAVNGGLYSSAPDLEQLIDGDPKHTLDYRSLYEQVLSAWFGIADNQFQSFRSAELAGLIKLS